MRLSHAIALGLALALVARAGLADDGRPAEGEGEAPAGVSEEAPAAFKAVNPSQAAAAAAAGAASAAAAAAKDAAAAAAEAAQSKASAAIRPAEGPAQSDAATPAGAPGATGSAPAAAPAVAAAPAPAAAATEAQPSIPSKYVVAAKQLFGAVRVPASLAARSIGSYARGCLSGAQALPIDGPNWQAMRLSRNRNWGHPELIKTLERFADEAWRYEGWRGLLVGDISQPRGGPMSTGHASHQIGLDADVWFTPMPEKRLSDKERETLEATSMLAADGISVNPKIYTETHTRIVKRMASYDNVERVLVHPAIKKAMCEQAGTDRGWLAKVRPYWGHYYHFHVRIGCPAGVAGCVPQAPPPGDDGCGKELAEWIKRVTPRPPEPAPPPGQVAKKEKPEHPVTLDQLPQECRVVLNTGNPGIPGELLVAQKRADTLMAAAKAAHEKAQAAHAKAHEAKAHEAKPHEAKHAAKAADAAPASPAAAQPKTPPAAAPAASAEAH